MTKKREEKQEENLTFRRYEDGEGDGWFVKLSGVDAGAISGLMDPAAYKAYLEGID